METGTKASSIPGIHSPMDAGPRNNYLAKVAVPTSDQDAVFGYDEHGTDGSILQPISTDPPISIFANRAHVVSPARVRAKDRSRPIPTNKFYGNLVLGDSHAPIWTHPYGLRWDSNGADQQGLAISHIDDNLKAFGSAEPPSEASRYYINPFLVSIGLSAMEFDAQHDMTVGDFGEFGCTMVLSPASGRSSGDDPKAFIRVPIVRGMAFITGVYQDLTPRIFSNILVRTLTKDPSSRSDGWVKYRVLIEDGITWLLYAKPDRAGDPPLQLAVRSQGRIEATSGKFTGLIQIAKLPVGNEVDAENLYERSVGVYATKGDLVVQKKYVSGTSGGYKINWDLTGNTNQEFIHFTLPHQRQVLTDSIKATSLILPSTTKGKMIAYTGSTWRLHEPKRLSVGFLPEDWSKSVTDAQLDKIRKQAAQDVDMNFDQQTNLDSMYFSGKGLAKFALLCLVVTDVLKDNGQLQQQCLDKLKQSFARFMNNKQMFPLVYDTTWKGLVSVQGLEHGALSDFGNTWYNDHHYHYGYFIHAAAIIRHLDPQWKANDLTTFVNSLLRDVANPSTQDPFFPVFRSFDWFMGHSWSQGIFASADGKDEESTSEDINLYYAIALWGKVANQPELEQMGQLMLTVARRSIQSYFLLEDDNVNHPKVFIGNKVTGILFENKVDHATYFSSRIECIQGIQMIPATPALPLVRRREAGNGAWSYFAGEGPVPLDDGMTRTWALFYVASQHQ
ncbi:hypothetical protein BGZ54_007621 [Gamsiella multidivaricata]|nr:hypothetical protein BGZ54_007621 [Gamsiella multidivaricata]